MKKIKHLSDEMLIEAYRDSGSQKAALVLYKRYEPLVQGLIGKVSLDHEEREDLFQEIEIRIFDNLLHSYRELGCFRRWIVTISVNAINDYLRRKAREPLTATYDLVNHPSEAVSSSFSRYRERAYRQLERAVEAQSPESRRLLEMIYKERKTYSMAAEELGISKSGSHKRLRILLPKIKEHLHLNGVDEFPDDDSFIDV